MMRALKGYVAASLMHRWVGGCTSGVLAGFLLGLMGFRLRVFWLVVLIGYWSGIFRVLFGYWSGIDRVFGGYWSGMGRVWVGYLSSIGRVLVECLSGVCRAQIAS